MFVISKLLNVLTQPLAWVAVLLVLGLLLQRRWRRAGLGVVWAALFVLLLQGWEPLPDALLRKLEAQHPAPVHLDLSRYAGIIVLGGSTESSYVWEGHDQPALNGAAERLTAALPLLLRDPRLVLLYTGGEGELLASGPSEAERARRFYAEQGVPPARLLLESASRNTHDNAVFSAALPGVDRTRPWLLITSAWHMPRSLLTFRKAGWNVTPWPTDYRAGDATPWHQYSLSQGAAKWQTALHELVGLMVYRLRGWL
ncbi:YdcF family protein [Hylemonella sp. W303a]|uniref:YdcF family protein n=1 Tax=Hylemonella sp. W303a TaxID=3389873 RepID=UPI00396B174C